MRGVSPAGRLLAAAIICLGLAVLWISVAVSRPYLGLRLGTKGSEVVVLSVDRHGPARVVAPGTLVSALDVGGSVLPVVVDDLVEEPDAFDAFADMDAFFARQSRLASALRSSTVVLVTDQGRFPILPASRRPIGTLPAVFWFQLLVGSVGFLIGAAVLALRPRELTTRLFFGLSTGLLVFTSPAALYSTRELAIDGTLFRTLSAMNQGGAVFYGCFLVALFLTYPRRLVPSRALLLLPCVYLPWYLAGQLRVAPDQDWGTRLPVMSQMLAALVLGGVQWRATRGDPRDRAALRWFGLALLVGSGLFVSLTIASRTLGFLPPVDQGYAFGFFLLMDVGLALGLRRYRLFELETWSYRIVFWLGAGLVFLGLDVALAAWLGLGRHEASTLALVVCALAYLPLRAALFQRFVSARRVDRGAVLSSIVGLAFTRGDAARRARWEALLRSSFDPLGLVSGADAPRVDQPAIVDEGLAMVIPAIGTLPSVLLSHPSRGRALFGPADRALVASMVRLLRDADADREAYDRGAREERSRIARDLHDEVGATLVTGLHQAEPDGLRSAMRDALTDLRSIVGTLSGERVGIAELLADLRRECADRLALVGVDLDWSDSGFAAGVDLDHAEARHLAAVVREVVTNVMKHAGARRVSVRFTSAEGRFELAIEDDGIGLRPSSSSGHGLENLRARAREVGGDVRFVDADPGLRIEFGFPWEERA